MVLLLSWLHPRLQVGHPPLWIRPVNSHKDSVASAWIERPYCMDWNALRRPAQNEAGRARKCTWIILDDLPAGSSMDELRLVDFVGEHLLGSMA